MVALALSSVLGSWRQEDQKSQITPGYLAVQGDPVLQEEEEK